jgi:hypothetical protein
MNQARIKRDIIGIGASVGGVPANLTEARAGRTLRRVDRTAGLLRWWNPKTWDYKSTY